MLLVYEAQMITIAFCKPERYELHLTFWDCLSQYYHWMRPIDKPSEAAKKMDSSFRKNSLGKLQAWFDLAWQNWILYALTRL